MGEGSEIMSDSKIVLILIAAVVGLVLLYAYIRFLFNAGYDEDEVHLHIFFDMPLRLLDRINPNRRYSSDGSSYQRSTPEYLQSDDESYASNCPPEIAALMNARPVDLKHNDHLLSDGGWRCSCGRVNARYVTSCGCGRNKDGDTAPVPEVKLYTEQESDELENAAAIREYRKLMDDGIISPEEFESKKKQLLGL